MSRSNVGTTWVGRWIAAAAWIVCIWGSAAQAQWAGTVDIIGHRGDSGNAPENTLPSLNSAFAKGVLAVEADIRLSKNGTLWLMHDEKVDRTTNGKGFINKKTDSDLAKLDAGSWFSPAFAGTPVPKLVDALNAANGQGVMYLDLKLTGLATKIRDALNATGFAQSNTWLWAQGLASEVTQLHSTMPNAKIIWSGGSFNGKTWQQPGYFSDLLNAGVWGVDVAWDFAYQGGGPLRDTPEFITAARNAGVYVSTYTLNDPNTMAEAIYRGVNGFETNFPERGFEVLASSSGSSTLTFKDKGTNVQIPAKWGSFNAVGVTGTTASGHGTPWVELSWSVKNNTGDAKWEFYNDTEWNGAAQFNDFTKAQGFDVLFTPASGFGIKFDSFVFDDYVGFDPIGSAFTWTLFRDDENGSIINSATQVLADGQNLLINTGMTSAYAGPVLLRISAATNPAGQFGGFDSAITNLAFSMSPVGGGMGATAAVPEPAGFVLVGLGVVLLAVAGRSARR
jgi:glycerophosphoryl diester phosphodiesterase